MIHIIQMVGQLLDIATQVIYAMINYNKRHVPTKRKVECRFCRRMFAAKKNGNPYKHKCPNRRNDLDEQNELLASCKLELENLYDNKESISDNEYLERCNLLQQRYNQIDARISEFTLQNRR